MAQQLTRDEALRIARKALDEYQLAATKEEIEEIFLKYGREGIGYKPLCRMFFSAMRPENAVRLTGPKNEE